MNVPKPKKKLNVKKRNDELWAEIVKLRAGGVSELSGKTGIMHAHHIIHKPNLRLRWELDNGICLAAGEHKFGVHGAGAEMYRALIINRIGMERWERLKLLRGSHGKTDALSTYLYLQQQREVLRNADNTVRHAHGSAQPHEAVNRVGTKDRGR